MSNTYDHELQRFFGKDGLLQKYLPEYEYRSTQEEMSSFVADRLTSEEHGIVEAGTGIGKSFAYLIPAFICVMNEGKKGAISTETKTLQHQLLTKEIPILQSIMKKEFDRFIRVELCLGGGNYLCRRRYEAQLLQGKSSPAFSMIADLLDKEVLFSRLDITIQEGLWQKINRKSEFCLRSKCSNFAICPFQKAKKNWHSADILLLNHYLFFSNISAGKTYLPYTDFVIFDEGHSVPEISCKQLGFVLFQNHFSQELSFTTVRTQLLQITDASGDLLVELYQQITQGFARLYETFERIIEDKGNTFRLLHPVLSALELEKLINSFLKKTGGINDDDIPESARFHLDGILGSLVGLQKIIVSLTNRVEHSEVLWLEKGEQLSLHGQPVIPEDIFKNEINSYYPSIILTSATVAVNEDFSFIQNRTSLNEAPTLMLKSDYNYKEHVMLYYPERQERSDGQMVEHICNTVLDISSITGGNTLVLFNSYMMLEACESILFDNGKFSIVSQSEFSAYEAVEIYKREESPILLGTHSFWQGIDLPGTLLKNLVITKLPFDPPERPDIQGMEERLKAEGQNPFISFFVPKAVIKFRQGFGRLIRRHDDRGVVAVIDPRVHTKRYGSQFLKSLPECRECTTINEIEEFCSKNGLSGK